MKTFKTSALSLHSFLLFFLVVVFQHSVILRAQEVEDEREFDYIEGSKKGPDYWGELKEEWAACKNGNMQSPIDLSNKRVKIIRKFNSMKRNYKTCNATLHNRGHDISLQWDGDAGSIEINGTDYVLRQCHWHSHSEHTINGRKYDLELHLVHQSLDPKAKNKIAVLGVLYKMGRPDEFLSKFTREIASLTDIKGEKIRLGEVDPADIKMAGRNYYRYMGSLTVPPCTEGVIWSINKRMMTVSKEQVKMLKTAVEDYAETNARPLQPLNRRPVHLYDDTNSTPTN